MIFESIVYAILERIIESNFIKALFWRMIEIFYGYFKVRTYIFPYIHIQ